MCNIRNYKNAKYKLMIKILCFLKLWFSTNANGEHKFFQMFIYPCLL